MSKPAPGEGLSDVEQRSLELIQESGGIHQSELWKELDIQSRKASRIVSSLVDADLVEREEVVHDGHNTYFITPVRDPRDLDFSLLMAGDMISPFVKGDKADTESDEFSEWIMNLVYEE